MAQAMEEPVVILRLEQSLSVGDFLLRALGSDEQLQRPLSLCTCALKGPSLTLGTDQVRNSLTPPFPGSGNMHEELRQAVS